MDPRRYQLTRPFTSTNGAQQGLHVDGAPCIRKGRVWSISAEYRYVDPVNRINLTKLSAQQLIALHRSTLRELYDGGIVRTMNAPQGDYAERLVAEAYGGELAPNSEKSWDVATPEGVHIQVKSRVLHPDRPGTRQMSVFRSWSFDVVVVILFSDEDLSIARAVELEAPIVKEHARYVKHVNGWRLIATPQVLALGRDITQDIQGAALTL